MNSGQKIPHGNWKLWNEKLKMKNTGFKYNGRVCCFNNYIFNLKDHKTTHGKVKLFENIRVFRVL